MFEPENEKNELKNKGDGFLLNFKKLFPILNQNGGVNEIQGVFIFFFRLNLDIVCAIIQFYAILRLQNVTFKPKFHCFLSRSQSTFCRNSFAIHLCPFLCSQTLRNVRVGYIEQRFDLIRSMLCNFKKKQCITSHLDQPLTRISNLEKPKDRLFDINFSRQDYTGV